MKKICPLFIALIALCACNPNEPTYNPTGGGGSNKSAYAKFSYKISSPPYEVTFTNESQELSNFTWDFGDAQTSRKKDPTHTYSAMGTYAVTLTGYSGSQKFMFKKSITIAQPKIYVAGYRLSAIPYENKYYCVKMEDDDWFGTNWGFRTVYTPLLMKSDLPYEVKFNSPQLMDKLDGDNYYTVYVYWSNNTSTEGTQCLKQKLYKSEILTYPGEHTLTSDNKETKVVILMEYK